ncbi:MAG: endolytic transglycosylase MltG, partial [Bacteroidota bacterium]
FIPNTYEFYWNTSAREFIERMHKEFQRFWDKEKKLKAEKIGLNPVEVTTMASIVEEESTRSEEMPRIAGVYINRLERGMRLQADPTIKFAIGDFSVNRILDKQLKTDSPYNTYKYTGLPPGPISFPHIAAIEAVLNYEEHDYLYFAAKPDLSGYHNFSKTHNQHIRNAKKYQEALNQKKIMK